MTETVELKSCPFCGGEAKTTESKFGIPKKWRFLWGVYCDGDCGTFFDCREPSETKAITAWNTRAQSAQLQEALAEVERLRKSVKAIQALRETYCIAGANLLVWITDKEIENIPKKRGLFGSRSEREMRDWASDIACRAHFAGIDEAIAKLEQPNG